jgi:hypothetical protein
MFGSGGMNASFISVWGTVDAQAVMNASSGSVDARMSVSAAASGSGSSAFIGTLSGTFGGLLVGSASGTPAYMLDVAGTGRFTGALTLSNNLIVDTNTFVVDSVTNRVGIGTATPAAGFVLDIAGAFRTTGGFTMPTAGTASGRMTSVVGDWFGLTLNATYSPLTEWSLDDTSKNGWFFKMDSRSSSPEFAVWRIPTGANPHADARPILMCKADDTVVLKTPNAAPTDTNLVAASVTWYLDQTNHKLKVRVKYADGVTMKTGEIALT